MPFLKFILLIFLVVLPTQLIAQDVTFIEPSLELFKKEYPEGFEFPNNLNLDYSGDINGDGFPDFHSAFIYPNLETKELEDFKTGYKIYYGSDSQLEDSGTEYNFENIYPFTLPSFTPVGDLNGDGCDDHKIEFNFFFDLSCGDGTDTMFVHFDFSKAYEKYTTEIDINNDGFQDILVGHSDIGRDRTLEIGIIYGAENPDSIKLELYEVPLKLNTEDGAERTYREASATARDVDGDGKTEILVFGYSRDLDFSSNYNNGDFLILQESDSLGLELVFAKNLPFTDLYDTSYFLYTGNFKPEGMLEVHISDRYSTNILIELTKENEVYELIQSIDLNEQLTESVGLYPIGDFDNDGTNDFFNTNHNGNIYSNQILFGTSELGIFNEIEVSYEDRFISNLIKYAENPEGNLGDINGDGYDDFIAFTSNLLEGETSPAPNNYLGEGLLFQFGNSSREIAQNHELYYEVPARQEALSTFNAGDFNDDGIKDYGVLFKNSITSDKKSRIELFFGGTGKTNWETPDLIFQTEDGYQPSFPTIGDFNGDGVDDIAINFQHQTKGIYFYWGGSNPDNIEDHQILVTNVTGFEEFLFDYNGFIVLENISDINGDDIDDLAFAGSYYNQNGNTIRETFLVYGGEIATTYDLKIDELFDNIQILGDIDADGKNEFLASRSSRYTYIYEGFDESMGESFSLTPEYELTEYYPNVENNFNRDISRFGFSSTVGDFNGDGDNDIAISATVHRKGERVNFPFYQYNGGALIFIYYGGTEFDIYSDQEIKIPIENLRSRAVERLNLIDTEYVYSFKGELGTIPDFSEDQSSDALFIGTNSAGNLTNSLVFINNGDSLRAGVAVKAKNLNLGLGSINFDWFNNKRLYLNPKSAIGDFNNDGEFDILLPQTGDPNFPEDQVLLFSVGVSILETSSEEAEEKVMEFSLAQNYPNPFNPTTYINFSVPSSGEVKLEVFDITGRLVSTLINENKVAGTYNINFDASQFSSGVYIYRLSSNRVTQTRKMTLIK